jgi:hypothetical protein
MAISFAQADDPSADWCRAEQGTGRALFSALDEFSRGTGFSSLNTAPLTVMGVCAAGQYAFHLCAYSPTHIKAFVTIGGGKHDLSKVKSAIHSLGYIVITQDRAPYAISNLSSLYSCGSALSAPWVSETEEIAKYDAGMCSVSVITFLQLALSSSLNQSTPPALTAFKSDIDRPTYTPMSICAKRIPILGDITPSTISLGLQPTASGKRLTCSFTIISRQANAFDSIIAPRQNPALQTVIRRVSKGTWILTCRLDAQKLPLGPTKMEIPVRFVNRGQRLLGGSSANLTCVVTGEVNSIPVNLSFGALKPGETRTAIFRLKSNAKASILVGSTQTPCSWVRLAPTPSDGVYACTVTLPADFQDEGFAGYLQLELSSPIHRALRILYYGTIDLDSHSLPKQ